MNTLRRKKAISVGEALSAYLRQARLSSRLNERRIFETWDLVSGAGAYTTKKFYRDGVLYLTINSSAARMHLSMQKDSLLVRINEILSSDPLYDPGEPPTYVRELKLK